MTNFLNVIGYHPPNLSTNRTMYMSCLLLDGITGQLKGQLTHHACVSGQNASCEDTVVSHFAKLTGFFLILFLTFSKMYNQCLISLSNYVIVLINW